MAKTRTSILVKPSRRSDAEWRSDLLTDLALTHLAGSRVYKSRSGGPYQHFVEAGPRVHFFVATGSFSSRDEKLGETAAIPEIQFKVGTELMNLARSSLLPVILFVWDSDADHGRYFRFDQLPASANGHGSKVTLPQSATITGESLEQLVQDLQSQVEKRRATIPRHT